MGGLKSKFFIFVNKNQFKSNKLCYKVSLCKNFRRQSCSRTIPLSNVRGKFNPWTLNLTFSPKVTHLQQRRFRRIIVSAIRASKKVQLSWIGIRLGAFQQAVDEVRTLPLTLQRVAQKANLSFKRRFPYISVTDEVSDFRFGIQLGFAETHHQVPLEEKVGVALG